MEELWRDVVRMRFLRNGRDERGGRTRGDGVQVERVARQAGWYYGDVGSGRVEGEYAEGVNGKCY